MEVDPPELSVTTFSKLEGQHNLTRKPEASIVVASTPRYSRYGQPIAKLEDIQLAIQVSYHMRSQQSFDCCLITPPVI